MNNICPKCAFAPIPYASTECPRCGIIFSKCNTRRETTKPEPTADFFGKEEQDEPERHPPITLKSKVILGCLFLGILYFIGLMWHTYLYERNILSNGLRAMGKVTDVRTQSAGRSRRTYTFYAFSTNRESRFQGSYRTGKFSIGESVEIAYLADRPLENVPVRACHGVLFTLFVSIAGPVFYVGLLFWKYPDFSKYMKDRLKRIRSV